MFSKVAAKLGACRAGKTQRPERKARTAIYQAQVHSTYWVLSPHSLEVSHLLMCLYFVSPSRPGSFSLSTIDI